MATDIRTQIHQLVDTANDDQLEEVLELLQPSNSNYTKEDIDRFHKIAADFEKDPSRGMSVEEAHSYIRNKYKNEL
jgi:hypothetical protein